MNLTLLVGVWLALFASLLLVTILRWSAGRHEDDHLHVMDGDRQLLTQQAEMAHRLDVLDRWKAILLAVVIGYGLFVAAVHLYQIWQSGLTSHFA